jgi:thiol-disulfide isomerase/thioredoxin
MKKQLFIISALLFSLFAFSQGIQFEHGTWKEVLQKAQQTNKPIFIDVYTSWCGPCRMMSQNVFPLVEVGKAYNANFICYQVDAEKGDGIEIAKKYGVNAFPTYLFLKADGAIFSRAIGYKEAKDFIAESKSALADMNDPKPIAIWEKEYIEQKNNPAFLLDYMTKKSKLGMSNATLFDEYLKLTPEEGLTSDTIVKIYIKEGQQMRVNSFAFENLLKNKNKYIGKLFGFVSVYLQAGVMNTVYDAAKSKNDQLLATAIKAYDQIPEISSLKQKAEIYMEYYQRTGETDNYLKYATDFCNNYLLKISIDSIDKKDQLVLQNFEEHINSAAFSKLDSTSLAQLKTDLTHAERNKIGESLNSVAWQIFNGASNKNALQDALSWSSHSLELSPKNVAWLDTYANLLYKLGQKEQAIAKEEEALRYIGKKDNKWLEETLAKMKAGEKTWKN